MFNTATEFKSAMLSAISSRFMYEAKKASAEHNVEVTEENFRDVLKTNNSSMFDTLKAIEDSAKHDVISNIMFLANCDAERINRSERSNARYNVYAYEKDINIARCAASVERLNHYTKAILQTAKKFAEQETELLLTHDDAQSACSLSVKTSDSKRERLIVKYQKHVSAKTASTQSSSSINALQSFNVLIETRDASNKVAYKLNMNNDLTQRLLERC
jgi:hypothetical protein